ncbi:hypothetical protein [Conexibacter sp. DBS9H8]|uniref:hypothetical protein n=1 Tax=Conexibacter sp. DBS9H8 TaxID=2937801 RepID=UPI00200DEBA9|nr:hypothetical protein [Conexibacter sp. DBS9H8]
MSDAQTGSRSGATGTTTSSVISDDQFVPAAGEEIHLPPGTPLPLILAIGITLVLVGLTEGLWWIGIGAVLFVVSLVIWIRDTRNEIAHLPDEHGTPAHH